MKPTKAQNKESYEKSVTKIVSNARKAFTPLGWGPQKTFLTEPWSPQCTHSEAAPCFARHRVKGNPVCKPCQAVVSDRHDPDRFNIVVGSFYTRARGYSYR